MTDLSDFVPPFDKSAADIYAEMEARANYGVSVDDPAWIDTRVGSAFWWSQMPCAVGFSQAYTRMNEVAAAAIPVTSWGSYLDLWATTFATERKAATFATGQVDFYGAPGTLVATGARVGPPQIDPDVDPPTFETTGSGVVAQPVTAPSAPTLAVQAGGTLVASTTYQYVVTASDVASNETAPSASASATTTSSNKQVQVTVVPGAGGGVAYTYNVYRRVGSSGPFQLLIRLSSTGSLTWVDTGALVPNATVTPPAINQTGLFVRLPAQALDAGAAGNVGIGTITDPRTAIDSVTSINNATPMSGGADEETDAALKDRLTQRFSGQGGGNQADYARWALDEPGVGRVTVVPNWNGLGTVLVVVMDVNGRAVSSAIVADLQTKLDPVVGAGEGIAPIDHDVTVTTPAEVLIDAQLTSAGLAFASGYSLDGAGGTIALRSAIVQRITDYIGSLGAGDDVLLWQVEAAVGRVTGLLNVTGASPIKIATHGGSMGTADIAIGTNPAQVAVPNLVTFV